MSEVSDVEVSSGELQVNGSSPTPNYDEHEQPNGDTEPQVQFDNVTFLTIFHVNSGFCRSCNYTQS